jgi:hypothetical protein
MIVIPRRFSQRSLGGSASPSLVESLWRPAILAGDRERVRANAVHRAIADGITREQADQADPEREADGGGLNLLPGLGVVTAPRSAYA